MGQLNALVDDGSASEADASSGDCAGISFSRSSWVDPNRTSVAC